MVWWKYSLARELYIGFALGLGALVVSSCQSRTLSETPVISSDVAIPPETPEGPSSTIDLDSASGSDGSASSILRSQGTGELVKDGELIADLQSPQRRTASGRSGDSYIYRNAPIDSVVNDILAESYGLSYIVDPNVRGEITLRLENIASEDQAISALAAALELQGFSLSREGETYIIMRAGSQNADEDGRAVFVRSTDGLPSGTNFAVIAVEQANAEALSETLNDMGYSDIVRSADTARNLIAIAGTQDRLEDVLRLIRAFDVNWLEAISTALVPLENTSPDELLVELEPIFARTGGLEFIQLNRLNAILVLGDHEQRINQALEWINRLDVSSVSTLSNRTLIYEARHLDAEQLLRSVQDLFSETPLRPRDQDDPRPFEGSEIRLSDTLDREDEDQLGSLRIVIDESRNAILARGQRAELEELEDLLSRLDNPQPQILIEATIVEVTLTDDLRLGVQWNLVEDELRATFTDATTGVVSSRFPGGSVSYVDSNIQAVVNALATVSDVEIISSPRVTTLNNLSARLQVGDQVPVTTQSAVSVTNPAAPVVNSVSFRDTGVILEVRPRTRGGGMIEVQVSQEVSAVAETTTSNIDSPTITQRRVDSTLVIPDGATAVLGGLISSTRSLTETGVPVLKDIPGLGRLFSSTGQNDRRTELVVLIRPSLVTQPQSVPLDLSERLEAAVLRFRPELLE